MSHGAANFSWHMPLLFTYVHRDLVIRAGKSRRGGLVRRARAGKKEKEKERRVRRRIIFRNTISTR